MTQQEFLEGIAEALDCEIELSGDTILDDIDEYDSIGVLSLMSYFDELGIKVSPNDFEKFETVQDLINLAGDKIDG